ncbi:hypothetical protein DPMN_079256 [Dreissena polymorpha]|uniref:Uncharacterized protein n=1 Tax=Dreissena polymorpha TaxID=45954 RepID=A0A9D3YS88_DREPO|nr:hypothetical protein DPMN_079256 [Dreissena polymorpha]
MKLVVPDHIPHHLEETMSRQTKSFTLPILLKNEAKYEDCVCIMDSYNQQMSDWYRKAGRTEAAMEYFGIQDPNSSPTKHEPPENIMNIYDELMDGFLSTIFGPLSFEEC